MSKPITKQHFITHFPAGETFAIDLVEIISGPPGLTQETEPYHHKVFELLHLPEGFRIKPTTGDAFLTYKDDGTLNTVCKRRFYQRLSNGKWLQWPFMEEIEPLSVTRN